MFSILLELLALAAGFTFLSKGADALVDGGVALARRWGLEPTIIGLTVIAWGTSMPEIVVAGYASWTGEAGAAMGTVLGSNVANIGLVLGVTALILPSVLRQGMGLRDGAWMFGSLGLLTWLASDGTLDRMEGALLLGAFLVYELILFRSPRKEWDSGENLAEVASHTSGHPGRTVLLGSVVIAVGARLTMLGGEGLALRFGVPGDIVGLTVFAVGTSLPELAAGIGSARRGHPGIGLGNVLGSNIFNTLAVLGVASEVRPVVLEAESFDAIQGRDLWVTCSFYVALLALPLVLGSKRGRLTAGLLLAGYVGYMGHLFTAGVIMK